MAQTQLLLALLLFAVLISNVFSHGCQNKTKHGKRIVGGIETDISEAKFYAFFKCDGGGVCGATLVTDNKLITAAHCLESCPGPQNIKVYAGVNKMENNNPEGKSYDVVEYAVHPKYEHNEQIFYYDIAVVHLKTNVERTNTVEPISYATAQVPPEKEIVCYGYGPTSKDNDNMSNRLYRATFTTKSTDRDLLIVDASKSSIRRGDSGGPCIYNNQLAAEVVYYHDATLENGLVMTGHPEILDFLRSQGL